MKILIIDDAKSILSLMAEWFKERDYDVMTASSGHQGLGLFAEKKFDTVILDVEMPYMNGFEVAKAIREMEKQWTPIIFMSGSGKESYYQKGLDAGGDFYFSKPLNKVTFNAFIAGIERMHNMRTQLQNANTELTALRNNTHDGIVTFDKEGNIFNINCSGAKILSLSVGQIIGVNINEILKISDDEILRTNGRSISLPEICRGNSIEYRYYSHEGDCKSIEMSVTPFLYDSITYYTGIMRDVTERKQLESKLKYLAQYDTLTGLPNRELFLDRLNQALNRSRRSENLVGILFVDLDRFKIINDTLGHDVGDTLLTLVAERLINHVRECDTVARFAGDEFVIIMDDFQDAGSMAVVSEKIIASFREPFLIKSHELFITTSIGIAVSSKNCHDSETLIKHADMAMYKAKEKGRNQLHFYTHELNAINIYRMKLSNALNRAIDKSELRIHYQPQLRVEDNKVIGAEALLRWNNSQVGNVSPAEFIPLLEETGLIIPVTEWLCEQTISQWKEWIDNDLLPKNAKLSINLSAKHFVNTGLVKTLTSLLKAANLSPENIVVEITETAMMSNTNISQRIFDEFTRSGIQIALDDFGTGYSSLSYISRFPINFIKIDQTFIERADRSPQDRALILAIINMGRSLDLKVVAEGVDSKRKLGFLAQNNCDIYQGFLFAKALSVKEFELLLRPGSDHGKETANCKPQGFH